MNLKDTKNGVLLSIFVKPNSPSFKIVTENGEIIVYATDEPERGKVNKEIIKRFKKDLGLIVEIASGQTSRQKVLLVRDANKSEISDALKKSFNI